MKYHFTGETKQITIAGQDYTVRRIRYESGPLGGWIESENNLSSSGKCLIGPSVTVAGNAVIKDNAIVLGQAVICGNVFIIGNARVEDRAVLQNDTKYGLCITDNVVISGAASLKGSMVIDKNAVITDHALIIGGEDLNGIIISDDAFIGGKTIVKEKAGVWGTAHLTDCVVGGQTIIDSVTINGGLFEEAIIINSDADLKRYMRKHPEMCINQEDFETDIDDRELL